MTAVPYDRARLEDILVHHTRDDIKGCRCGWAELGRSWPGHVANVYEATYADPPAPVAQPCPNCVDLAATLRRVVANESNHYDRYWTPPLGPVTDEWLDDTEAKMREALTDAFCDDAAAVMITLIAEVRRGRALHPSHDGRTAPA